MSIAERLSAPCAFQTPSQLAAVLFLLALLVACSGTQGKTDHGQNQGSPPAITLTAAPAAIVAGSSTTLTWSSTNATSVSVDNGIGQVQPSGSQKEMPQTTTTYNATATGPGGTAKASATVSVSGQQGVTITATSATITAGNSTTLTVTAPGANSITIDNGGGTFQGAQATATVHPTTTTTYTATANFTGGSLAASLTITVQQVAPAPTVTITANPSTINQGQPVTLTWTSTNATSLSIQGVGPVAPSSGTTPQLFPSATTVYTITATGSGGQTATAQATVSVNGVVNQLGGVFTYKNDNARTGQNLTESVLTPSNVTMQHFGKLFAFNVDGYVFGQPLYVPGVDMSSGTHNVVYAVTEHDSVYAFDADGKSTLWHVSFINPAAGITTVPTADVGSTIFPEIGITSTPVIDPSTGTIFVEASTKENGAYFHRLHALDITSGAEKFGGPVTIQGSVAGTGVGNDGAGHVPFQPRIELQRAALLLLNNAVYIAFASHGDNGPYHGWVFAYDANTLQQVAIWNDTPNGEDGGIWHGGGGLAADSSGAIYGISGNGTFDGGPDYGDTFFRLTEASGAISVADFFTPSNQQILAADDLDLGSGGPMLLPDQPGPPQHLLTGAGKEGTIYLVDRDAMGGYNRAGDHVLQEIPHILGNDDLDGNNFSTPTYWQGRVYYVGAKDSVKAFKLSNGTLGTSPDSQSSHDFALFSGTPAISANGNTNGILWLIDKTGALYAYDPTNLADELYDTDQAGTRDTLGTAAKFSVPTVANGRVYVGTTSNVVVYGLLN